MTTERIEIFQKDGQWLADFVGDQDILELFGTTELTTAFFAPMSAPEVIKRVQRLNPHTAVSMRDY